MKNLTSKLSVGSYLIAAATVLTLVSLIVAIISNGFTGYDMHNFSSTVLISIGALLLGVASIMLPLLLGDSKLLTVLPSLMVIVLSFAIWTMVYGKMDVFGTVLFSDLEKGFPPAEAACSTGIAAIALYLLTSLVTIVGCFFRILKAQEE